MLIWWTNINGSEEGEKYIDSRYNFEVEWAGLVGKLGTVYACVGEEGQSSGIKDFKVSAWTTGSTSYWI